MSEEDLSIDNMADNAAETPAELTIGQKMRQAREAKGLEIVAAANQSKIKVSFLQYLENDEFNKLPNLLTAKGFTKVYAALLGLNVDEIVQQFNQLFPGEAGPEQGKEIKVGMAVDKRTLFPNGLKTMNRAGSITRTTRSPGRSKKNNKMLWRMVGIAALFIFVLMVFILFINSSMHGVTNHSLRQQTDISKLEAKDTPEAQARREYDQNKIYIEATALKDTYVTLTTMADGRAISQGFMLRRGDFKSWDGSQYIRLRASVSQSLQLIVNGKNEGVLEEREKMFLTTAGEAALKEQEEKPAVENIKPQNNVTSNTTPPAPTAAPVQAEQQAAEAQRKTSILENI